MNTVCKDNNLVESNQIVGEFRLLFSNLPQAATICKILYDDKKDFLDFIVLEINKEGND